MRIRTVKPEFWESESIGRLSRDARLLFIALFNFADDAGVFRASPALIAKRLFPYDADAKADDWLAELEHEGCISLYQVNGNSYGIIPNFLSHQRIDHPSKSALPAPIYGSIPGGFSEGSMRLPGGFPEASGRVPGGKGREGKGREGKGKEGIGGDKIGELEGAPAVLASIDAPEPPKSALKPSDGAESMKLTPDTGEEDKTPPRPHKQGLRPGSMKGGPPDLFLVMDWAESQTPPIPHQVAMRFHDHFESNGWKVGGRTPMKNWQAALRGWVARQEEFIANKPIQQKPGSFK